MLQFRKQSANVPVAGTFTLQYEDGTPLCLFPPEVIDNCRRMVTNLACRDMLPRQLALMSTLREEGTTFLSLAMGTVLAHDLDAKVGVVELNWWSPGMYRQLAASFQPQIKRKMFGRKQEAPPLVPGPLPENRGLAAVLKKTASFEEVIIPTRLPNLELVPAGELQAEERPILARGAELRNLVNMLSERYDYILFDLPALLQTSDSIVLASLADAGVVVIRQGVTPVSKVRSALNDVQHVPLLGVVLNQVKLSTPGWVRSLLPQE